MFARYIAANFINALILGLLALAVMVIWARGEFQNTGPLAETTVFEVKRGDALIPVANRLADAGVISSPTIFRLGARYNGTSGDLKFGEYEIKPEASMEEVLALITSGRGLSYQVTFPEGWSSYQIVQRLNAVEDLTGEIAERPAEGSLAPNTYAYSRGDTRQSILDKMMVAQVTILDAAWDARAPDLPLNTKEEALILASIVEKETGVSSERNEVAGVFVNRLRKGMKLQTDPTVIYGLIKGEGSLGRGLRRSELLKKTDYNTYIIPALPPTPIANPGKAAIEAALNPSATENIFFVADGTGGHVFAETLREHNANVAKWRKIERERKIEAEKAKENQ